MVDRVLALPEGTRLYLLAPIVRGRKGEYRKELAELQKKGFQRVKINGHVLRDRRGAQARQEVQARHRRGGGPPRRAAPDIATRLADSFETALELADGIAIADRRQAVPLAGRQLRGTRCNADPTPASEDAESAADKILAKERDARAHHLLGALRLPGVRLHHRRDRAAAVLVQRAGRRLPEVRRPRHRAAVRGRPGRAATRRSASSRAPSIPGPRPAATSPYYEQTLESLAKHFKVSMTTPWEKLPKQVQDAILYGTGEEEVDFVYEDGVRRYKTTKPFEGVIGNIERRWRETESDWVREELSRYQAAHPCDACGGYRLKPQALAVKVGGKHIGEVARPVDPARPTTGSPSCPRRSARSRPRSPRASSRRSASGCSSWSTSASTI